MTSAARGSRLVTLVCAVVLAAGCKGGGDDSASASSPATVSPTASASDAAPTISGTTATTLKPNVAYAFTPSASDPNGDTLSFQIQNKPGWAIFNTVTGQLSGTPGIAQIGAYADIIISVSDGKQSASLAAFTIKVAAAATSSGVTLAWVAPTENVDGTALTDLAGYMIAYGTSRTVLSKTVRIDNPSIDRHVLDDLAPGTYYFGIKAYSSNDVESAMSAIVSKVVD